MLHMYMLLTVLAADGRCFAPVLLECYLQNKTSNDRNAYPNCLYNLSFQQFLKYQCCTYVSGSFDSQWKLLRTSACILIK